MWNLFDVAVFAAGYAAAVYSWPLIKVWVNGASAEITSLRLKAAALEAKIRTI